MKLTKFTIKNFRSITDGSEIHFGNYSVLVGKNNEGKTTVLMALRLAMDTLKLHAYQLPNTKRTIFKLKNAYEWDRDFPISLQEKPRIKKVTTFKIDFELSEIEKIEFRKEVGSKINGSLCIEISFDENNISTVLVPKRGSAALSKKSNQIAKYIANKIQFTYIPAIRTEHEAIGVINEMIEEELSKLESESKFKEALDVIEELQKPVLDKVATTIQESLHKFLPNINNVELSILGNNRKANLRKDYLIEIDDGDLTDIKFKGDGVKSLTAIGLLKDRNKIINGASIIAIEEPESHLHPSAMHELKQAIQKLAEDSQVVVSTHNPIFVDRETLANNLLVSNNKVKAVKKINDIRICLGIRTSDNLIHASKVLLVEGETDQIILTKLFQERSLKIAKLIKDGDFNIVSTNSASKLPYNLRWYQDQLCSCYVLVDNDSSAKESILKLLNAKELDQKSYMHIVVAGKNESEIENLFKIEFYEDIIFDQFSVELSKTKFSKDKSKWSNSIENTLKSSGKSIIADDITNLKKAISKKAVKDGVYDNLALHNIDFVDNLIFQIENYFIKN